MMGVVNWWTRQHEQFVRCEQFEGSQQSLEQAQDDRSDGDHVLGQCQSEMLCAVVLVV
jgi:hypothetical protein